MDHFLLHAATVFVGLFAIMNPIANTPVFISLTSEDDRATRKAVAWRAVWLALLIVVLFSVGGKLLFDLFGISLPAFRVTGGLLVFLIGFHMLQGEPSAVHNPSEEDNRKSREAQLSVAVSPLGVPILAGPGTIAAAMNFASGGAVELLTTIVAFFLLCWITYCFFVFGEKLVNYVGQSAIKVVTRLMGLILAVVGTNMLIEGVYGAVRAFK